MFDSIAADQVSLADVSSFVKANVGETSGDFVRRLYTALRSWTWKALNSRRRDAELRGWYELLRRLGSFYRSSNPAYAERITTLQELVHESIIVADKLASDEVVSRRHVRDVLKVLCGASTGTTIRLIMHSGLKRANLSRVLTMMEVSGLIELDRTGKRQQPRLTAEGRKACARLGLLPERPKHQYNRIYGHLGPTTTDVDEAAQRRRAASSVTSISREKSSRLAETNYHSNDIYQGKSDDPSIYIDRTITAISMEPPGRAAFGTPRIRRVAYTKYSSSLSEPGMVFEPNMAEYTLEQDWTHA